MSDVSETKEQAGERHGFGAEVGRLLDLVVHSLYSDREIFLRELVANAADAIDRRRFESLTDTRLAPPGEAKVRIVPNKPARTLLIADSGIGMTKPELVQNLGTIARSGTRAFGETLEAAKPEDRPNLIGQFGVGFYSAFMVAERVEVVSRRAGSEEAWLWTSDGAGEFTVSPAERDEAGTDVTLHMKPDAGEFLDPVRLEAIVRKWADHITVPITISRDGRDVQANEGSALWRKNRAEVTEHRTRPSTAISGICSTRLGRRCTGRPRGRSNSLRYSLFRARGRSICWRPREVAGPPACPPYVHHR